MAGPMKQNFGKRKPKDLKNTIKRMLSYMKEKKAKLAVVVICIIISSIASVTSSMFIRVLIDDYVAPMLDVANPSFMPLLQAILTLMGFYVVGIFSTWLYSYLMIDVSQGILKKIRDDMFERMQHLPLKYFDTHTHGNIMSHFTNDTDTLRQMISQSVPQVFSSVITIVSVFIAMVVTSIPLTILVLVTIFIMTRIAGFVTKKCSKYFVRQQQSIGKINGYIDEMMSGQKVVKVFYHEEEAKNDFNKLNEELCFDATQANKYANILMPIMGNLGHLLYVLIALCGGILTLSGVSFVSVGAISSFLLLSKNFTMPITNISQQINSVVMALAGAERVFELMDECSEQDNGYVSLVDAEYDSDGNIKEAGKHTGMWAWKHPHQDGTITYEKLLGDVVLDDVDFGYNENKLVLHNISIYAKPGQKVAFVGATGAGKTTITNLINRFYDIADGKIRYDGININKIKKSDLRRSLGIVLQDVNLFTGTVMENIRYGKLDATDEEVYSAARLAGADDFIRRLPNGYDTVLSGDGSGLSQGQCQLISIARAAVADPPVMILDEATSSIDTRTEAIVQKGMDSLMENRTVFVIAHRLSTVQNSDVIMVLDHGRIIERGSHEELIAKKGNYYQLYTGAFELE